MGFFSAALTADQLTKLRGDSGGHSWAADQYVSINPNTVIFAARVNGAVSTTTGYASVEFDTVTTGAFGDVRVDQRVLFSATNDIRAAYLDTRVREALDSNTIPIAETSVDIADNDYIFVIDDYPLIDRLARPTSVTVQAKDYNDTFQRLAPVPNGVQPVYVGEIDSGTSKFRIVLNAASAAFSSYPADNDAASISSYAWAFTGVTATVISGSLTGSAVTVDVTEGHGFGHLTLTDSAGVSWVFHFEIHAHGDTYTPVHGFEGAQITGDLENGFTCNLTGFTGVSSVIDNTRITIWRPYEYYNGTEGELVSGINVDFIGWIRNETDNNRADPLYSYVSDVSFEVIGIAQRLAELEGQALAIRDNSSPDEWDEIEQLMPWRAVVHYWQRHTTLLNLFPLDFDSAIKNTSYRFPMIPAIGGNPLAIAKGILDQVNGSLEFSGDGRISICKIGHYLTTAQRSTLLNLADLDTQDYIEFTEQRSQFKRVGRVLADGAYWDGTVQRVTALRAVAPGHAQSPGADQAQLNNQILTVTAVQSAAQAELNLRAATALAIFNDDGNQVDLLVPDGYHAIFIPGYQHTYTLTITTSDNMRGIAYTTATKWFCVAVSHTHSNGDEQGAGMGSREVRVTLRRLLAIPTAGETIEQIADGDIAPALPDLPPFPAFDFEFPETIFPLAGLTSVDPKLLLPPKGKVAKVDGSTLIMKSTDGTKAFLVTEAIALTYPKMRDITPSDQGSYEIQQVLFDPLNKADSAGNKYAYELGCDSDGTKVWRTSNVFALQKPIWLSSAELTGLYNIIRGTSVDGGLMIYSPGSDAPTENDFTEDDHDWTPVADIVTGGSYSAGVGFVHGDNTEGDGDRRRVVAIQKTISSSTVTSVSFRYNLTKGTFALGCGGTQGRVLVIYLNGVEQKFENCDTAADGTDLIFTWNGSVSGVTTIDVLLISSYQSAPTDSWSGSATITEVTYTTGTNAAVRYSSDRGETFGSAATVGTTPGIVGGFDVQRAGPVSYAAMLGKVRKATTLGGAYSDHTSYGSSAPVCVIIPYYALGSTSSKNTVTSTPDYLVALDVADTGSQTLYKVTGAASKTNITPVSGIVFDNANCITTQYGTHIAVIGVVSGDRRLYTSIDTGANWTLRASGLSSAAAFIRTRRGDARAKNGGNKGQIWLANGAALVYSFDWGANRANRTLSVSCNGFDVLG